MAAKLVAGLTVCTLLGGQAGLKILREDMDMTSGVVVISLGGGSSMDAAKAIAVIAPDSGAWPRNLSWDFLPCVCPLRASRFRVWDRTGDKDVAAYCMEPALKDGTEAIDLMSMVPKALPTVAALPIIGRSPSAGRNLFRSQTQIKSQLSRTQASP